MPTAAKLIAAVLFGALAWGVSELVKPGLPEGIRAGRLAFVDAGLGAILGWHILGARAGDGRVAAMGHGLTTAIVTAIAALLVWAGYEMVLRSTKLRYDGPVEALQDMAALMLRYAVYLGRVEVMGALLLGAVVAALVTEGVARRWT